MRSRLPLFTLCFYLTLALLGCTSKPSSDNNTPADPGKAPDAADTNANTNTNANTKSKQPAARRQSIVAPAGTTVTISLGSQLGSKLSQTGQTFSGTVAKEVVAENTVVIPAGTPVSGTVTDAKPLGRFAGGAVLALRLDSINVNGADMPVQAAVRTFSAKGKGKRTAVMAGGGAALGGLIGGLAGGGKGAAIGLAAGGGAGAGGAAFTGNKDIVLPAEAAVSFQLTRSLEIR
jgi:hypothetical protein